MLGGRTEYIGRQLGIFEKNDSRCVGSQTFSITSSLVGSISSGIFGVNGTISSGVTTST